MGLLLPAVSSLAWHRLATVDDAATVPILEIALLRKVRMLSELDVLTIEQLAGSLTLVSVAAGERIVREGDVGHAYFVVADGELLVTQNDQILRSMHRGEGFGEIALLKSVRRTASVTARTDATLYTLASTHFIEAVTSHPPTASRAQEVVESHLASDQGSESEGLR
jgi:CRP-like cAMP-binding protein